MSGWIPVEKRLPVTADEKLVSTEDGSVLCAHYTLGEWWVYDHEGDAVRLAEFWDYSPILAWMPKPAPYKGATR